MIHYIIHFHNIHTAFEIVNNLDRSKHTEECVLLTLKHSTLYTWEACVLSDVGGRRILWDQLLPIARDNQSIPKVSPAASVGRLWFSSRMLTQGLLAPHSDVYEAASTSVCSYHLWLFLLFLHPPLYESKGIINHIEDLKNHTATKWANKSQ